MKNFLISLLFVLALNAQNKWYVDAEATGSNTGRSWTDAWKNLDSTDSFYGDNDGVNWSIIQAGDTIFIDAGTLSLSKSFTSQQNHRVFDPPVVICPSWEPGHTGTVYLEGDTVEAFGGGLVDAIQYRCLIDNGSNIGEKAQIDMLIKNVNDNTYAKVITNSPSNSGMLILDKDIFTDIGEEYRIYQISCPVAIDSSLNGIKITGITFIYDFDIYGQPFVRMQDDSLNIIENCTFINNGFGGTLSFQTTTRITFTNNKCINLSNNKRQEQDWIGMSAGAGGNIVSNNLFVFDNHLYYLAYDNNASITFTDTSLTDTRLTGVDTLPTNGYVGAWVVCGGWILPVTRNTGNTFYSISGWDSSGVTGHPANGRAWNTGTGAHRDGLQMSGMGDEANFPGLNRETYIINNILLQRSENEGYCNAMLYADGLYGDQRMLIAGNIVYDMANYNTPVNAGGAGSSSDNGGFSIIRYRDHPNGYSSSLRVYYNTFISHGVDGLNQVCNIDWIDTLDVRNNLMIKQSDIYSIFSLGSNNDYANLTIDYNGYAEAGQHQYQFGWRNIGVSAGYVSLSEWRTGEFDFDVHIDTMNISNVTFTNLGDTTYTGYYTNLGRNLGNSGSIFTQYPFLQYDMAGNLRVNDMGALEFVDGAVVDSTPSNVTFITDYLNAELNTAYTGHIQDLIDFDSGYVHINRGWYNIDGQLPWKDASQWTMVYPTNDIYVRDTSSTEYYTAKQIVVTVGNASDTWTLRTKTAPSNKSKIAKTGSGNSWIGSNGVPIRMRTSPYIPPSGEPDNTPPSPPTSFLATNSGSTSQYECSWINPLDSDLYSIQIYEGAVNDTAQMSLVATVLAPNTTYLRTGRTPNTTYWAAVKAVDDSGNVSYFSNTDNVTTAASDTGQPLQNLKLAYLTQSFASHLYDHSGVGDPGTTTVPAQVDSYNVNNGLTGYNAASVTRIYPDYPASGDMMWNWTQVFWDGTLWGNTNPHEYIVDEYLTDTTYSIIQVTFGPANAGVWTDLEWNWPWVVSEAVDTVNWQDSHTYGIFKWHIRKVLTVMEQYPDKFFVLWTPPPICQVGCGSGIGGDGERQAHFNTWMLDTLGAGLDSYGAFPENVLIYDVFTLLQVDYKFNPDYDDGPSDAHPNEVAASVFAPVYVQQVFDAARAYRRPD